MNIYPIFSLLPQIIVLLLPSLSLFLGGRRPGFACRRATGGLCRDPWGRPDLAFSSRWIVCVCMERRGRRERERERERETPERTNERPSRQQQKQGEQQWIEERERDGVRLLLHLRAFQRPPPSPSPTEKREREREERGRERREGERGEREREERGERREERERREDRREGTARPRFAADDVYVVVSVAQDQGPSRHFCLQPSSTSHREGFFIPFFSAPLSLSPSLSLSLRQCSPHASI